MSSGMCTETGLASYNEFLEPYLCVAPNLRLCVVPMRMSMSTSMSLSTPTPMYVLVAPYVEVYICVSMSIPASTPQRCLTRAARPTRQHRVEGNKHKHEGTNTDTQMQRDKHRNTDGAMVSSKDCNNDGVCCFKATHIVHRGKPK